MDNQYPIGKFQNPGTYTEADLSIWIKSIKKLPQALANLCANLDDDDLETSYREGGWTIKQLVHHIADSHINAYTRFKLALTSKNPSILPYDQDSWAMLLDGEDMPIESSLMILQGLHARWIYLMESMRHGEWERTYYHSADDITYPLWKVAALYAWHSDHHFAQADYAVKNL